MTHTTERSFIQWALLPYRRCLDFAGVSGTREFGCYCLFASLLNLALFISGVAVFITTFNYPRGFGLCLAPIIGVAFFATTPLFALVVRRFHNADYSPIWGMVILVILLGLLSFGGALTWVLAILALPVIAAPLWFLPSKRSEQKEHLVDTKMLVLIAAVCLTSACMPSIIGWISELQRPAVSGYEDANFLISKWAFRNKVPCASGWSGDNDQLRCKKFQFLDHEVSASAQFANDRFVKLTINLPQSIEGQVLENLEKQYGRAFGYYVPQTSFHYMYYDRGNVTRMWGGLSNSVSLDKDAHKALRLTFRYSDTY